MEVIAENHQFMSRLCTDDCDEQLSKPSEVAPCGISVHQSRRVLSTDAKYDEYVADTQECINASETSEHTLTAEGELSVGSGEVVPLTLPADSCTGVDNCVAEDSQSTCTNECALSVSAVTAKLADSDIGVTDHATQLAEPRSISRPKSLCSAKKSVCFPVDDTDGSANQVAADDDGTCVTKLESKRMSLLLRLFESKLFDMAIALPYLFNSKEPGVLAYLGQYFS